MTPPSAVTARSAPAGERNAKVRPEATKKRQTSGLAGIVAELPTGTILLVVVALLCVIGLVMVGSASSVVSISLYGSPWAILIRECMWMAVGVVAFAVAVRFDHRSRSEEAHV